MLVIPSKFILDFDGIWFVVEICWSDRPVNLVWSIIRRENTTQVILFKKMNSNNNKKNLTLACILTFIYQLFSDGGLILDTTELCRLMTMAFIQDHCCTRKQNLLCQLSHKLTKFSVSLNGICCGVECCGSNEPHFFLSSQVSILGGEGWGVGRGWRGECYMADYI